MRAAVMIATAMPPRRAQGDAAKVTVCGRVPKPVADALQQIASEMSEQAKPATVTLSQLVEFALTEFVEKRKPKRSR
jgi:hypothetical protein